MTTPATTANTDLAIFTHGLSRRFGNDVWALRDATFDVPYGHVFGLLGRNGSGKTTTVRILTTLTRPTSGRAIVAGHDIATDPTAVRASIGVTTQAAALDQEMTGREHLELICGAWGEPRVRARGHTDELLADFGLTDAANRVIGTYSGGMKRRLDIAGSLANNPRVLFLDEPTTGLDAQSRHALWDRVRSLRDSGTAVFLTTQYLEEADQLADTVAVLDAGRIIAHGTPTEIKNAHSRMSVRLRGARVAERIAHSNNTAPAVQAADGSVHIDVCTPSEALALVNRLSLSPDEIDDIAIVAPNLEHAYLALTGQTVARATTDLIRSNS